MSVMLALSAIFAVVISTISMPGDRAAAQVADATTAVEARAEAWFNSLTLDQAINALLAAADRDAVADVDGDADTQGRQYVDIVDPADVNLPIEFIKKAWDDKSATQSFYDGLPADTTAESDSGNANKAFVITLVDGSASATDGDDLYAVGNELVPGANAIRGFQSVELWWDHLTCLEARIAVGEDNDVLETTDQDTNTPNLQPETSAVCTANLNADGTAVTSVTVNAYSDVKAMVNEDVANVDDVGQAILGLSSAGAASSADNARAKQWWDSLTATERVDALYGDAATDAVAGDIVVTTGDTTTITVTRAYLASRKYGEITAATKFVAGALEPSTDTAALPLSEASKNLVVAIKELINDRWEWVYHMGGSNEMGISELVYWWDSLGDTADAATGSTQRRIAVGFDNEPEGGPTATFTAAGYSVNWNALNPTPFSADGKDLEEQVFEVGQAILFTNPDPLPNVAAWWATLNADQMVNVVYGSPLLVEDGDSDATTARTPVAHENDRKMFQVPYAMLTGHVIFEDLHPATTVLLGRHGITDAPGFDADESGAIDTATYDHDSDPDTVAVAENAVISTKTVVDTIAAELFDPPTQLPPATRATYAAADNSRTVNGSEGDDNDFDWPYNSDNKAANVADWWETTDCRVMRLAVGEDNDYFQNEITRAKHPTVTDDTTTTVDESMETIPAETSSIYCAHFPGHDDNTANDLSEEAQKRIVEVGRALLNLDADRGEAELGITAANALHAGRPSFNEAATGMPTIAGTAQVGAELTSAKGNIADEDGVGTFEYQWFSGDDPVGTDSSTYTVQPTDVGKSITVRYSFVDGERYPESRTSSATSVIAGSPGQISRIEPAIRSVTLSAGDEVKLAVDVYGLQNVKDNKLLADFDWTQTSGSNTPEDLDGSTREIEYTAPSSSGTYTITATLGGGQCQPKVEAERETACSASITVQVRRPAPAATEDQTPPVNPPGEIPTILTDSDGNQYEVITPVEGGTFDAGEGYSIHVPSGAVPNGEVIGVRMSAEGEASNVGMSHQRYTLGGNTYGIHVVDGSGAAVSSTVLEDPARVCVPLPDAFRTKISDLGLVGLNSDGSLTVYAANVRLGDQGTQVCGNVSGIPATVAVGSQGAPEPIPTEIPLEDRLPETGATAPSSNGALFALILGFAVLTLSTFAVIYRRRPTTRHK